MLYASSKDHQSDYFLPSDQSVMSISSNNYVEGHLVFSIFAAQVSSTHAIHCFP